MILYMAARLLSEAVCQHSADGPPTDHASNPMVPPCQTRCIHGLKKAHPYDLGKSQITAFCFHHPFRSILQKCVCMRGFYCREVIAFVIFSVVIYYFSKTHYTVLALASLFASGNNVSLAYKTFNNNGQVSYEDGCGRFLAKHFYILGMQNQPGYVGTG